MPFWAYKVEIFIYLFFQIEPLRSALQKCKDDNVKLASSLEAVVSSNTELKNIVQTLQNQIEKKTFLLEQTNQARLEL